MIGSGTIIKNSSEVIKAGRKSEANFTIMSCMGRLCTSHTDIINLYNSISSS